MFQIVTFLAVLIAVSNGFLINVPSFIQKKEHCDSDRFHKCFDRFDKNLDVPESVKTSAEFFKYLDEYVERNGPNGFAGLCGAAHMLAVCFGDQFGDCTSVRELRDMGLNETDAYAYAFFAGELQYQCGSGYDVWYHNLECYGKVSHSEDYEKKEKECVKMLDDNIKKDPDNVCEYFQEFTACLSQPFNEGCGKAAAYAVCSTMTSGFRKTNDKCDDLNCDYFK